MIVAMGTRESIEKNQRWCAMAGNGENMCHRVRHRVSLPEMAPCQSVVRPFDGYYRHDTSHQLAFHGNLEW